MAEQPETVDAEGYVVVSPQWDYHRRDAQGRPILIGAKIEKVTRSKPEIVRGDSVVTRLTMRIDSLALLPLAPSAVVHIGASDVTVIEVQAENPDGPEEGA